jgi:hypothetical protein
VVVFEDAATAACSRGKIAAALPCVRRIRAGQEGGDLPADILPIAEKQMPAPLHADKPGAGATVGDALGCGVADEGVVLGVDDQGSAR